MTQITAKLPGSDRWKAVTVAVTIPLRSKQNLNQNQNGSRLSVMDAAFSGGDAHEASAGLDVTELPKAAGITRDAYGYKKGFSREDWYGNTPLEILMSARKTNSTETKDELWQSKWYEGDFVRAKLGKNEENPDFRGLEDAIFGITLRSSKETSGDESKGLIDSRWDQLTIHFVFKDPYNENELNNKILNNPDKFIGFILRQGRKNSEDDMGHQLYRLMSACIELFDYQDQIVTNGFTRYRKRNEHTKLYADDHSAAKIMTTVCLIPGETVPHPPNSFDFYKNLDDYQKWGLACCLGTRSGYKFTMIGGTSEEINLYSQVVGIAHIWAMPNAVCYVFDPESDALASCGPNDKVSYYQAYSSQFLQSAHSHFIALQLLAKRQSLFLEVTAQKDSIAANNFANFSRTMPDLESTDAKAVQALNELVDEYLELGSRMNRFRGTLWFDRVSKRLEATKVLQLFQRVLDLPRLMAEIEDVQERIGNHVRVLQEIEENKLRQRNEKAASFWQIAAAIVLPATVVYTILGGLRADPDQGFNWINSWIWAVVAFASTIGAVILVRRQTKNK